MSSLAGYYCLECVQAAPYIGHFGLLGLPDLTPTLDGAEVSGCSGATFGLIREALRGIGIVRSDLERFARWLGQHEGHRKALDLDGSDPDVEEIDLDAWDNEWSDDQAAACGAAQDFDRFDPGFIRATYLVVCTMCATESRAPEDDVLLPPASPTLTPEGVAAFLALSARWDAVLTHGWTGAVDPIDFLPTLATFLQAHTTHPLEVRLHPTPAGSKLWIPV